MTNQSGEEPPRTQEMEMLREAHRLIGRLLDQMNVRLEDGMGMTDGYTGEKWIETTCVHCGEPIRFIGGRWMDAETHETCKTDRRHAARAETPASSETERLMRDPAASQDAASPAPICVQCHNSLKVQLAERRRMLADTLDQMTALMQPQPNGHYLYVGQAWNLLLDWLRKQLPAPAPPADDRSTG